MTDLPQYLCNRHGMHYDIIMYYNTYRVLEIWTMLMLNSPLPKFMQTTVTNKTFDFNFDLLATQYFKVSKSRAPLKTVSKRKRSLQKKLYDQKNLDIHKKKQIKSSSDSFFVRGRVGKIIIYKILE